MHELIISALLTFTALAGVTTTPATARPAGVNGQIVFSRYDDPFTVMFTVNPDGSHEQQVVLNPPLPPPKECPRWPPDGTRIATCGRPDNDAALIVNADDGSYRELAMPEPETLFTVCPIWSPDAERLACESFGQIDPSLNRIYTIRSSDGGGLPRMTTNPGGDDLLGDYSPDGRRFMFARSDQNGNPVELLVVNVNVNGTGLKRITHAGTLLSSDSAGSWSPQRNEIMFSRHVTADVHSTIWVVHANGTGLHEIHIQGVACGGANSDPNGIGCADTRWSPDGKKLVVILSNAAGKNITTVNADGTGLTQVNNGGDDFTPHWGTHPLTR